MWGCMLSDKRELHSFVISADANIGLNNISQYYYRN